MVPVQRGPGLRGIQGPMGVRACQAGGMGLVGLLHIQLGEDVLPAGLLGQLLPVVSIGVDQVEELRRVEERKKEIINHSIDSPSCYHCAGINS